MNKKALLENAPEAPSGPIIATERSVAEPGREGGARLGRGRLDGIQRELHKIGVNVNQIALAANRGRVSMVKEQWAGIDALRQRLPLLRATLSQVISERRRRGVNLYRGTSIFHRFR